MSNGSPVMPYPRLTIELFVLHRTNITHQATPYPTTYTYYIAHHLSSVMYVSICVESFERLIEKILLIFLSQRVKKDSKSYSKVIDFLYSFFYSFNRIHLRNKNRFKSTFLLMHKTSCDLNVRTNLRKSFQINVKSELSKVTKVTSVVFVIHRNEFAIHQPSQPKSKFPNPPKPPPRHPAAMVFIKRASFFSRGLISCEVLTQLSELPFTQSPPSFYYYKSEKISAYIIFEIG